MPGKYEVFKDRKGEFRFRLKAANGEKILASEGYASRSGALNGIKSVKNNARLKSRFDRRQAKNGKHYFVLKAGNHQIIGQSEMYNSTAAMENGIASVMKNARSKVEDG